MCGSGATATSRIGVVRAGKGITLILPNKRIADIIKIIKSLQKSEILIDGTNQTIKL